MTDIILDIKEIQKYLPHRYPFLLVDKILNLEPGKKICGIKNVTINESFFQGHFPDHPVMPGVLIIEALAQVCSVLLLYSNKEIQKKLFYLSGLNNVRFRKPVFPGDQLKLEGEIVKIRSKFAIMNAKAYIENEISAEATIMASLVEK
ncbi:MAG: 3-hydroxyacyl-ACP dehydratase FabZ [bacterium]